MMCDFRVGKMIKVAPEAKLHGRLGINAYSNSHSSYECLRKSPNNIDKQQNRLLCIRASVCLTLHRAS